MEFKCKSTKGTSTRQMGQGETEEYMAKNGARRSQRS